ncbi:hypothetical protein FFI16_025415 [Pseudomonas sp. KBS0710]|nr:hypothetical protein FFI16_025415 [Pseudomonas sp. KBS0710]
MWERACSRRRCVSQQVYRLIRRFREQARSHIGFAVCQGLLRISPCPWSGSYSAHHSSPDAE